MPSNLTHLFWLGYTFCDLEPWEHNLEVVDHISKATCQPCIDNYKMAYKNLITNAK